jgi:hypothetical protein
LRSLFNLKQELCISSSHIFGVFDLLIGREEPSTFNRYLHGPFHELLKCGIKWSFLENGIRMYFRDGRGIDAKSYS